MFRGATTFNQNLSDWDVSNVTDMRVMFSNSALSTDNYDAILNSWSEQNLNQNIELGAQGINYCDGETARQKLIDDFGWTIEDGGLDCSTASVKYENLTNISIYPNPVNNELIMDGLSDTVKVSIYNLLGKLVFSKETSREINVSQLQSGLYILKLNVRETEVIKKFIKN